MLTVPVQDDKDDLDELDELLSAPGTNGTSPSGANGASLSEDRPAPPTPTPAPAPPPLPRPAITTAVPKVAPPKPPPLRKKTPASEEPLFFTDDMDALLGIGGAAGGADLDEKPGQKRKPAGGVDAMSLEEPPRNIVLSPQRATLLAVVVVVLLGLAFTAGFLIASNR